MMWTILLANLITLCSATKEQADQIPLYPGSSGLTRTAPTLPEYTGIGFDFASNYVTAAVSFPNGTHAIIATLPGTEEYNNLIYHLSLQSSRHLAPPYQDMGEWLRDQPRQKWRRFLRHLGLPSSNEAAVFGSMLKPLKEIVEEQLGHPITHGLASFPYLTALYPEDVWDAFKYVGLVFQRFTPYDVPVPDFAANYASQGYCLCKDYKNQTACKKEQHELNGLLGGEFSTFNFHLSNTSLMLMVPIIRSPYAYIFWNDRHFEDFDLGLRSRDAKGVENYWSAVENRIEQSLMVSKTQWDYWIMHTVFVTGEGIYEKRFVEMIKRVCENKGIDVEFFMHESTTLTATGTAELAKRDLYLNPGKPHPTVS